LIVFLRKNSNFSDTYSDGVDKKQNSLFLGRDENAGKTQVFIFMGWR
jgi:hypothetical protein